MRGIALPVSSRQHFLMQTKPQIAPELAQEFVAVSHGDFERVKALLEQTPALANAAWDWGGGDWESALGAASHVGRRDIALYLLEHGARLDLFAATMLGELEIVQAALKAFPGAVHTHGPHGIPLLNHAKMGGHAAMIALIESHLAQTAVP
jgi:hypothetical protein